MGLLQGKDIINFVVLHNFDEEMLFDISSMGLETFAVEGANTKGVCIWQFRTRKSLEIFVFAGVAPYIS
jgi:hypothetical protein